MGNRAVITTKDKKLGVYLHWNGGRDSVEAFLKVCKDYGFRPPELSTYGWSRLCQIIANYFGMDGLSIGIGLYDTLDCDNGDNGVYIIENWEIVGREFMHGMEQQEYNLEEMVTVIKNSQPIESPNFN